MTTTGSTQRVMAWLEQWLRAEWPDLNVYLADATVQ